MNITLPKDVYKRQLLGSEKDPEDQVEYICGYDSDTSVILYPGDRIEIVRAPQVTRILKLSKISFLETLRTKMS